MIDEPTVITLATQVCTETLRKMEFKLTKQLQITEKALREDYQANIKSLEEKFKKEMQLFTLQHSVKKGIDGAMELRSPSFVPQPSLGLDEMHIIRLCKETFDEEYAKKMVQYHMDITQEIDEVERAKELLKGETESQRREILNILQPNLQAMSRLSARTVERTQVAKADRYLDE